MMHLRQRYDLLAEIGADTMSADWLDRNQASEFTSRPHSHVILKLGLGSQGPKVSVGRNWREWKNRAYVLQSHLSTPLLFSTLLSGASQLEP